MRKSIYSIAAIATLAINQLAAVSAYAEPKKSVRTRIIDTLVEKRFSHWVQNPELIAAIKAQNEKNADLSQADIDRLDEQWRAERKAASKPLIDEVLGNVTSQRLKSIKADAPKLYTEIFVMDNKGINVGQSDVTSDYWQGDESKFQKTYDVGPKVVFIDDYEVDESTGKYQAQVSLSIADPETGDTIGAVTIGLDAVEILKEKSRLDKKNS